ncbi:MAG: hypothetical protein A3H27_08160 [Acidobacteria bacterium RIFCSPLOWO2_02_FULL_59_13]|nr:MAG: hypothetical protein A3H27_08160 [Acidobacteria bacterium RIFCSPLOWO2_02_FULL_59_13]
MTASVEFVSGRWFKFSEYFFEDANIHGNVLTQHGWYDPWELYWASAGNDGPRPYQSLLDFGSKVRLDISTRGRPVPRFEGDVQEVLSWCSEWGLLGLFHQYTLMIRFPARWREVTIDGEKGIYPWFEQYHRIAGGWHEGGTIIYPHPQGQKEQLWERAEVDESAARRSATMAEAITYVPEYGHFGSAPLVHAWGHYFPDNRTGDSDDAVNHRPDQELFWYDYSEPLDEFLLAAARFVKITTEASVGNQNALSSLQDLVSPITPGIERFGNEKPRLKWLSPSLLASFAMMFALDLTQGYRVLACEVCGRLFSSSSNRVKFCSSRCRNTAQKRAYRTRKQK